MLFEKIIPYNTDACILLSNYLAATVSNPSSSNMRRYLQQLKLIMALLQPNTPLHKTPLFHWQNVNSTCWYFEEFRCLYALHGLLTAEAQTLFNAHQHKESKKLIEEAVTCCEKMLTMDWYRTPYVQAMPEMQQTHLLSKLLATKGLYYYNAHCFKNTRAAAKLAYQFTEIGNALWKTTANPLFTQKLLAEVHYAEATHTENFQQKLSHITAAENIVNQHHLQLPHIQELYADTIDANTTVHYEKCTHVVYPVLTVEQALNLLSIKSNNKSTTTKK